ncbi:Hypothetical protein D9617_15g043310 [Elsinoe fawcettii]|nr:Hypothetical protein D9617_15g043310 [Elsinoe fawcettii]
MSSQSDLPTRTRSARQSAVRRSTRGPLDDEDPLAPSITSVPEAPSPSSPLSSIASPAPSTANSLLSPPLSALTGSAQRITPLTLSTNTSIPPAPPSPRADLSFLLRPQLYSPLPTTSLLPPFLGPTHQQPPKESSLLDLTSKGFFRHAAIKAASDLCTGTVPASDIALVLETFHVRLSCLLICGYLEIAAQEARPLGDYLARLATQTRVGGSRPGSAAGGAQGAGFVPWGLRVLVQRLSGVGAQDGGRRAVMGWYALAGECRGCFAPAGTEEEREGWRVRLMDLGVRVAGELVGMGEVEAATRHLEDLQEEGGMNDEMRARVGLLYVRVGDVRRAGEVVGAMGEGKGREVLDGLIKFADADYQGAAVKFEVLHDSDKKDALTANNYAIALLYKGQMEKATKVLETLVDDATPISSTLFNLATMYELATEKAVERKAKLVDRVASRGPENGGWERASVDFKL